MRRARPHVVAGERTATDESDPHEGGGDCGRRRDSGDDRSHRVLGPAREQVVFESVDEPGFGSRRAIAQALLDVPVVEGHRFLYARAGQSSTSGELKAVT
jgi:hypothetical protein